VVRNFTNAGNVWRKAISIRVGLAASEALPVAVILKCARLGDDSRPALDK